MKPAQEETDWLVEDCLKVYNNILNGIVSFESFLSFVKEEKSQSFIDGIFRASAYHHDG